MTNNQRAKKIVRDYESDKLKGVIVFGNYPDDRPVTLVYYSNRKATTQEVLAELDAGGLCVGWGGVKKDKSIYMRVPRENKQIYADCLTCLERS